MILFVNACIRKESRTKELAAYLLEKLAKTEQSEQSGKSAEAVKYEEADLTRLNLKPLDEETLNIRTDLIGRNAFDDPMFTLARQFADADTIVIAAPFWDLTFPAILKIYLENIYITGIVSRYGSDGRPEGLCRAKKLYYVTTAGGPYFPEYSYKLVQELAQVYFGIKETELIKAEMLDVDGFDPEKIIEQEKEKLDRQFDL